MSFCNSSSYLLLYCIKNNWAEIFNNSVSVMNKIVKRLHNILLVLKYLPFLFYNNSLSELPEIILHYEDCDNWIPTSNEI